LTLSDEVQNNLQAVVSRLFTTNAGRPEVLTEYQARFIREMIGRKHRKAMFVASTRVGKTEATSILALLMGLVYDNEEITIVAPSYKAALILFTRIKDFMWRNNELFSFVNMAKPFRRDEMHLVNGTIIRCISVGNPAAVLGFGATVLIVDEAEEIPDEVWRTRVVRLLAGRAGRQAPVLIMLGTPHTMNFFYEAYQDPSVWKMIVTWKQGVEAGILDAEEVEYARKHMSEAEFEMWYNGVFAGGAEDLFPRAKVLALSHGEQQVAPEPNFEYVFGVDIARFGSDETAIVVVAFPKEGEFEELDMKVVAVYTRSKCAITESVGFIKEKAALWNPSIVAVDEIGAGAGAVDLLREKTNLNVVGLKAMGMVRSEIYGSLLEAIESGRIVLLKDERMQEQLRSYRGKYTSDGRMLITKSKLGKDDVADALAFAVYAIKSSRGTNVYVLDSILKSDMFSSKTALPELGMGKMSWL
jgi:phage terminase large subunit-like protein